MTNTGIFEVTLGHHKKKGCRFCLEGKTYDNIVKQFNEVHNGKFTYPRFQYTGRDQKIKAICPTHGEIEVIYRNHLKGADCGDCSYDKRGKVSRKSQADFIKEMEQVHGSNYDLSLFKYDGYDTKGTVVCNTCLIPFDLTPHMLISHKSSCQFCYGKGVSRLFTSAKKAGIAPEEYPCRFYVLRLFNEHESFIKVGVTERTLNQRLVSSKIPYEYEVLKDYPSNLDLSRKLEVLSLYKYKQLLYKPSSTFDGETECLSLDCLEALMNDIDTLIADCPL